VIDETLLKRLDTLSALAPLHQPKQSGADPVRACEDAAG